MPALVQTAGPRVSKRYVITVFLSCQINFQVLSKFCPILVNLADETILPLIPAPVSAAKIALTSRSFSATRQNDKIDAPPLHSIWLHVMILLAS